MTTDPRTLHPSRRAAGPHDPVEVRSRFDGSWCGGFEVAEQISGRDGGARYRVRRLSDGSLLPGSFAADEISRTRA